MFDVIMDFAFKGFVLFVGFVIVVRFYKWAKKSNEPKRRDYFIGDDFNG